MRSARLGDLCLRFNVSMECTPVELKNSYHRMCLQVHPDVSTRDRKSDKFIALRKEYEEAIYLRKLGYVGAHNEGMQPSYTRSSSTTTSARNRSAAAMHSRWTPHLNQQNPMVYNSPYPIEDVIREFDLSTRIAGTLILITTLTLSLLALREFLVATAGSFWAYHYGSWSNFYIRRYDVLRAQYKGVPKPAPLKRTTSGDHSDFYERRLNKGMSRAEKSRMDKFRAENIPVAAAVEATGNDTSKPPDDACEAPDDASKPSSDSLGENREKETIAQASPSTSITIGNPILVSLPNAKIADIDDSSTVGQDSLNLANHEPGHQKLSKSAPPTNPRCDIHKLMRNPVLCRAVPLFFLGTNAWTVEGTACTLY